MPGSPLRKTLLACKSHMEEKLSNNFPTLKQLSNFQVVPKATWEVLSTAVAAWLHSTADGTEVVFHHVDHNSL